MLPLVAAGALYALLCLMLGTALPELVPLGWDADLLVTHLARRDHLVLLAAGAGTAVAAVTGGAAALVLRYAPTATARQTVLRRMVSADLAHLGAVTLLFLTAELAVVYGPLGGSEAASWTGQDTPSYPSREAALTASRAAAGATGSHLPTTAVVILIAYLAYLVVWAAWVVPRRYRRDAVRTADSIA
ncbi:hypothetical protein [uncultured Modestobacter sp.]|uniref:hypothetical protein n=1 Tax=uncultured Modestobacter sp. TaxID=380048 RepID=UPI002613DF32|nr:hypothetical protein [uncultured Modestobacter sp.]